MIEAQGNGTGRLFNGSYTTMIEINNVYQNEQDREALIAGLRKMISECGGHKVLTKFAKNHDEELSNLETELFAGEKSLVQDTHCINDETVKKFSFHGRTYGGFQSTF